MDSSLPVILLPHGVQSLQRRSPQLSSITLVIYSSAQAQVRVRSCLSVLSVRPSWSAAQILPASNGDGLPPDRLECVDWLPSHGHGQLFGDHSDHGYTRRRSVAPHYQRSHRLCSCGYVPVLLVLKEDPATATFNGPFMSQGPYPSGSTDPVPITLTALAVVTVSGTLDINILNIEPLTLRRRVPGQRRQP